MNGYTKNTPVYQRIANLIEQIPRSVRLQVVGDCIPQDGNIYDMERKLTGAALHSAWKQTEGGEMEDAQF